MKTLTVEQTLRRAMSQGLDRLDAQLLLLNALALPMHSRAWLLSHDTDPLLPSHQAEFEAAVRRRLQGEPVAYITGHKEFFGLDLIVDPRVLIPRPDTETLVEWALEVLPFVGVGTESVQVLDLGTGSGAIALALKASRPDLKVHAIDASEEALAVARENAQRLQLEVDFQQGSWLHGIADLCDVIVSNPPYIAVQDAHLDALKHEPRLALISGPDGLDDIRCIVEQASAHLRPRGYLLLEHGYDQAMLVRELLQGAGFVDVQSKHDLNGLERCSGGRLSQDMTRSRLGMTDRPATNALPVLAPISDWVQRWSHLLASHATVLDIACGHGRHMKWFADRGHPVTGIDRSAEATKAAAAFGTAVLADIENGPWPLMDGNQARQYAAVIVTNYLWRPLFPLISASIAPGGLLIYETFSKGHEGIGRPTRPDFLLQPAELLTVFRQLRVIAFEEGCLEDPPRVLQRIVAARPNCCVTESGKPKSYPL